MDVLLSHSSDNHALRDYYHTFDFLVLVGCTDDQWPFRLPPRWGLQPMPKSLG